MNINNKLKIKFISASTASDKSNQDLFCHLEHASKEIYEYIRLYYQLLQNAKSHNKLNIANNEYSFDCALNYLYSIRLYLRSKDTMNTKVNIPVNANNCMEVIYKASRNRGYINDIDSLQPINDGDIDIKINELSKNRLEVCRVLSGDNSMFNKYCAFIFPELRKARKSWRKKATI